MRGLLIALDGISQANVSAYATGLAQHLVADGVNAVAAHHQRADMTVPLAARTPVMRTQLLAPLKAGKIVVSGPHINSMVAYRHAAGIYSDHDAEIEGRWDSMGLTADLVLLLDAEPVASGGPHLDPDFVRERTGRWAHPGPRQLALDSAARDHLILRAGRDRTRTVVLPERYSQELTMSAIRSAVEWMMISRESRWPLEDQWRAPRPRLA